LEKSSHLLPLICLRSLVVWIPQDELGKCNVAALSRPAAKI